VLEFDAYLDRLASADPTPGGGSAATLVGALGAALVAMVARITLASPRHAAVHAEAASLAADGDAVRARFTAARPLDEDAYAAVVAAQALPRATEAEKAVRTELLQDALAGAAEAPLEAAALAAELLALGERAAALGNTHLMSDVDCALRFGRAALDASVANIQVNHRFLKNEARRSGQAHRLAVILDAARASEHRALAIVNAAEG
jgi:formiminotetrahydrofolate cyclodeaminase